MKKSGPTGSARRWAKGPSVVISFDDMTSGGFPRILAAL
jgi:peptidoglycan/xylan/chitin deacetylase (PgdA/CDA1 family)